MFPKIFFFILLSLTKINIILTKSSSIIILIRHGEKISDDYTDLSPEGQARADCLPELFTKENIGYIPSKIYANKRTDTSTRPYDTVIPLAKKLGLEIEEFNKSSNKKIKEFVKNTLLKDEHDVILVCSSHQNIPLISELIGKEVDVSGNKGFDKYFIFKNGKIIEKGKQSDYIGKCIEKKVKNKY